MQNVLQNRALYIAETGARVICAPGVLFICADNTNGTGGGARKNFHGTHALNAAFLDRFGAMIRFDYLPEAKEREVLVARTGCTPELAKLLVQGAKVTRAAADNQALSQGLGLRRLVAWAELLTDGVEPQAAFHAAVLDRAPEQDQESLREQLLLTYDRATIDAALNPVPVFQPQPETRNPTLTNPTPAGRAAASDFATAV
jgi:MoxR-like ATPase